MPPLEEQLRGDCRCPRCRAEDPRRRFILRRYAEQYRVITDPQEAASYQVRVGDTIRMHYSDRYTVADLPSWSTDIWQRSYDLLRSLLPEVERGLFEREHTLKVQTTKRVYVIARDMQTRIFQQGEPVAQACLQLTIPAPPFDRMIAEYLLLKNDEAQYLRTANVSPGIELTRRRRFQPWG